MSTILQLVNLVGFFILLKFTYKIALELDMQKLDVYDQSISKVNLNHNLMPANLPENQKPIKVEVVSRNPNIKHPDGIQPLEGVQIPRGEQKKQPAWKSAWQKGVKNFRNLFKMENQNPQEPDPKKQNKLALLIKERLEKVKDFNRLSVKEKAMIISLAVLAISAVLASSAFLTPTAYTIAGHVGPYLGLVNEAVSIGGVTIPHLTTLVGASGSFGTYGFLNGLGAANFATTTAGMYGVQAGTVAIGTGLLIGGKKLADKSCKLAKEHIEKLPPRLQKVEPIVPTNPVEVQPPILQAPLTPQNKPSVQNVQITVPENQNPQPQNLTPDNRKPDNVEINRGLSLGDLKSRYEKIISNNKLTEQQQNQVVNGMLNSAFMRFKGGAKDVKINEAIQICLLTNNYDTWKKFYQELGQQSGAKVNVDREIFDRLRNKQ
jgi:hypothetical protein